MAAMSAGYLSPKILPGHGPAGAAHGAIDHPATRLSLAPDRHAAQLDGDQAPKLDALHFLSRRRQALDIKRAMVAILAAHTLHQIVDLQITVNLHEIDRMVIGRALAIGAAHAN